MHPMLVFHHYLQKVHLQSPFWPVGVPFANLAEIIQRIDNVSLFDF